MKLYIFGTSSGTEPYSDRHHTAFALEQNGRLYWFDAGEGCAHTAHRMGVDLLAVSDIFISHSHMDHIGGLPHLLWTIRKISRRNKILPKFGDIHVYIANANSYNGVLAMLINAEGGYSNRYATLQHCIQDGILMENNDVTVRARHTMHLQPVDDQYQSFSFSMYADDKRVVYSGDFEFLEELDDMVSDGCDVLLVETGHHEPTEICQRMKERCIGQIFFLHHGRAIMENYDALLASCQRIMPNVVFCNDRDVFEF